MYLTFLIVPVSSSCLIAETQGECRYANAFHQVNAIFIRQTKQFSSLRAVGTSGFSHRTCFLPYRKAAAFVHL